MLEPTGLLYPYNVNRLPFPEELNNFLPKKVAALSPAWPMVSVIKMNSTYLEVVDKYFHIKGVGIGLFTPILLASSAFLGLIFFEWFFDLNKYDHSFSSVLIFASLFLPVILWCAYVIKKENFQYTHYPIRFNRKTRKVYVFRQNGTVMTEDWDKLFFSMCKCRWKNIWEIRGYRMGGPYDMIVEAFGLPIHSEKPDDLQLYSLWEFIRRYMEEGPAELVDMVGFVVVTPERRESFRFGLEILKTQFSSLYWLIYPLVLYDALGRWVAMRTGKIPKWPNEIEAQCKIDPNDQYVRDHEHLASEAEITAAFDRMTEGALEYQAKLDAWRHGM
jgi:hypothetical protein